MLTDPSLARSVDRTSAGEDGASAGVNQSAVTLLGAAQLCPARQTVLGPLNRRARRLGRATLTTSWYPPDGRTGPEIRPSQKFFWNPLLVIESQLRHARHNKVTGKSQKWVDTCRLGR